MITQPGAPRPRARDDANANILSTPTLLTLDNEEARIIVGQNVPFITGQYATTGISSTVQPFQTIERRDVGLLLRVQAADHRGRHGAPGALPGGLARRQSTSPTTPGLVTVEALARILGGRRRPADHRAGRPDPGHVHRRHRQGARSLGDIPVFGALFRYDTRTRTKTNLLMFLKPTVVRTRRAGPRAHVRALRLPAGRAGAQRPRAALVLAGHDVARAAAAGRDARHARQRRRPCRAPAAVPTPWPGCPRRRATPRRRAAAIPSHASSAHLR